MSKKKKRTFDFYQLEDRVLLDGDGLASVDDVELDRDIEALTESLRADLDAGASSTSSFTPSAEIALDERASNQFPSLDETSTTTDLLDVDGQPLDGTRDLSVIFVDAGVDNVGTLLADLQAGTGNTQFVVVHLAADENGIDAITDTLEQLSGVDAVHILSHGDGEGFQLGNQRLDLETAGDYAGDIASWGYALDTDADLLIYGCDLASTEAGRDLVDILAIVCDCDVAASDDQTGHQDLGADWTLEYTVGQIQTDIAFGSVAQANWHGVLDITSDLVLHLGLDEGSGSTAGDSSSQNNDGTIIGSPTWTTGKVGGALEFDGDFDRIDVGNPSSLDFGSGDFTISFWI
ncbi:MAG: DUF4347 domain-containing protein, partial [Planctomycetota bacterium]